MRTYDFDECLSLAENEQANPVWLYTYSSVWPDCQFISATQKGPSPQQKLGRDRIVIQGNGKTLTIDEKVSRYSSSRMFLEFWSVKEKSVPGWVCDPQKENDYVAQLWANDGVAMLFPYDDLRRAWYEYGESWKRKYKSFTVQTTGSYGTYTSEGTPVPVSDIWEAMQDVNIIRLPASLEAEARQLL